MSTTLDEPTTATCSNCGREVAEWCEQVGMTAYPILCHTCHDAPCMACAAVGGLCIDCDRHLDAEADAYACDEGRT